jgi:cobalt-precorrin 5A hydrolase
MERHAVIVAGFGFRRGVDIAALRAALALAQNGLAVTALATLREKAQTIAELAALLDLPLIAIDTAAIRNLPTITQSRASLAAYGVGSVAEAVALAAAGPGARLLAPRTISPDRTATCAIAHGVCP